MDNENVDLPWGETYARKADAFATTTRWIKEVKHILDDLPDEGLVLDLGCNTGRFIGLAQVVAHNCKYDGMDVNEAGLVIARERLPQCKFFSTMDGVEKETYDYVAFIHAINQVRDLDKLLVQVWDAMKPGARIAVMTHNPWHYKFKLQNLFNGYKSDPTIVREPNLGELAQLMWDAGFHTVETKYIGHGTIPWLNPRILYIGKKPL